MPGPYLNGNTIRLKGTWTDPNSNPPNAPIDPSVITLKYADPTGAITTATYPAAPIIKDSTGVYHADIAVAITGRWTYDWLSTGTGPARAENYFQVNQTQIP
jgi:hypothetical protein